MSETIRLVCHGGIYDQFGYYGWVVATDTQLLASHYAHATGNHEEMDSLRANLSAISTALQWVREVLQPTTINGHTNLKLYIATKHVYNRLRRSLAYDSWYPNQMLLPHMDMLLAIKSHLNHLTVHYSIDYFKSPKKLIPILKHLPWQKRLETLTTRMAIKALDNICMDTPFPSQDVTSSGRAFLYINQKLITKHFHSAISRAWCTSDLRRYLTHKFNWDSQICDSLDWYSFGSALQYQPVNQHKWTIKFVHEWLPLATANHVHFDTEMCPVCQNGQETPHHFLYCDQYEPTMDKLRRTIDTIGLNKNIDPWLLFIIQQGLSYPYGLTPQVLCQTNPLFPVIDYLHLLHAQTAIGWTHIHYGRFSLEWDRHQRRYLYEQGYEHPSTEPTWLRNIIQSILIHHHARWLYRNKLLHPTSSADVTERNQLYDRIRALYAHEPFLQTNDKYCFSLTLLEWETRTTYEMKRWLQIHTTYIRECRRQANKQDRLRIRDIRTYFSSVPNTRQHETTEHTPTISTTQPIRALNPLVPQQQCISNYFQPHSTTQTQQTIYTNDQSSTSTSSLQTEDLLTQTSTSDDTQVPPTQVTLHEKIQTSLTKYFQ